MKILRFDEKSESDEWDSFVQKSCNGTFLHSRRFLSYHGTRFRDESLVVLDEKERVIGLFPAARHPVEDNTVVSHPGITYGGFVAGDRCRGETTITAIREIASYFKSLGYEKLVYKAVPYIYHNIPFQDDLYALFRLGANRYRCDISATIDMNNRSKITKGRKYEINKARKHALEVVSGEKNVAEIYDIIVDNLRRQHESKPVHSREDLLLLKEYFPENILFLVVKKDNNILAALVLFVCGRVLHTQYIASREESHSFGALDFLIDTAINKTTKLDCDYFDFGISNENEGVVLNENLYRYKRSFGAGSMVHDFYEVNLDEVELVFRDGLA